MRVKQKPVTIAAAPATTTPLSPGLRRYLYFTSAITGACILIVQILGAKMLAPYLGTSHFVWTAQIAITLVALACGYYAGGMLVDRSLRLGRLYAAIIAAALYLTLTVAAREPVAYACLQANLAVGALLSSLILFFIPLALLAMVGPFFIRVLTVHVSGVGGNVGRLNSISTLGSFLGTVLIGYVLIPYLPNSMIMYLTVLLLLAVSGIYFVVWGRASRGIAGPVVAIVLGVVIGALALRTDKWPGHQTVELFRGNSDFGLLQVIQVKDSPRRYYLNDYLTQNTYDTNTGQSVSMFTHMLHGLARAYAPQVDDVLCIGLGVGIVPMVFAREGSRVDVVEINPAVVPIGEKFFGLEPARLNITIGDGRYFVNHSKKQYDAIVLDAFLGDSCPSHLMTREAFTAMRKVLKPAGVLVLNTFGDFEPGQDFFTASIYKTLTNVFPGVRIHAGESGNTLYVAGNQTDLRFAHPPDYSKVYPPMIGQVKSAFESLRETDPASGQVLTDDFNPVEFHDAANRERLRRYLAQDVRRL